MARKLPGRVQTTVIGDGRVEVDELDERTAYFPVLRARSDYDTGRATNSLKKRGLAPPITFVVVIAVVANKNDEGIVPQLQSIERINQPANLRIHE